MTTETKHASIRVTPSFGQLPTQLPNGLTGDDAARISSAFTAAHTASTRTVYGHAWRKWERWRTERGFTSLPGDLVALCAYLAERAESGTAVATLNVACSAIGYVHRLHDLPDPVVDPSVRRVRLGLRRTYGIGPRQRARALTVVEIRQIVANIDQSKPIGVRDTAIILLGFASALRRSELTALTLAEAAPARRAAPELAAFPRPTRKDSARSSASPTAPTRSPTLSLPSTPGVPCVVAHPGRCSPGSGTAGCSREPLTGNTLTRMIHTRALSAGLPADRVTTHSLRSGHATTAADAGVPLDRIAAQTRHRDLSALLECYIRPAQALQMTTSRDLGL